MATESLAPRAGHVVHLHTSGALVPINASLDGCSASYMQSASCAPWCLSSVVLQVSAPVSDTSSRRGLPQPPLIDT